MADALATEVKKILEALEAGKFEKAKAAEWKAALNKYRASPINTYQDRRALAGVMIIDDHLSSK